MGFVIAVQKDHLTVTSTPFASFASAPVGCFRQALDSTAPPEMSTTRDGSFVRNTKHWQIVQGISDAWQEGGRAS